MSSVILNTTKVQNINVEKNGNTTSVTKVVDKNGRVLWQKGNYAPFSSVSFRCDEDTGKLQLVIDGDKDADDIFSIFCIFKITDEDGKSHEHTLTASNKEQYNNNIVLSYDSNNTSIQSHDSSELYKQVDTRYKYEVIQCRVDSLTGKYISTQVGTVGGQQLGIEVSQSIVKVDNNLVFNGTDQHEYAVTISSSNYNKYIKSTTLYDSNGKETTEAIYVGTYTTILTLKSWYYWKNNNRKRQLSIKWSIDKDVYYVSVPKQVIPVYNGDYQVVVTNYDAWRSVYTIKGDYSVRQEGTLFNMSLTHNNPEKFEMKFSLYAKNDPNTEYYWDDEEHSTDDITMTIYKYIPVPKVYDKIQPYNDESQRVIVEYYEKYIYSYRTNVEGQTVSTKVDDPYALWHKNACDNLGVIFILEPGYEWETVENGDRTGSRTVYFTLPQAEVTPPVGKTLTYKKNETQILATYNSTKYIVDSIDTTSLDASYDNTNGVVTAKNAGIYYITFSLVATDSGIYNYKWSTTKDTSVRIQYTISKIAVTIPTAYKPNGSNPIYGQDTVTVGSTQYNKVIQGYDSAYMKAYSDFNNKTEVSSTNISGSYILKRDAITNGKVTFDLIDKKNYQWTNFTTTEQEVIYTLEEATPICVIRKATSLTYNGLSQSLISTGIAYGGTLYYKVGANGTYSTTSPTGTNAGTYTVYYKVKGDTNFNDVEESSFDVTISKKTIDKPEGHNFTFNNLQRNVITGYVDDIKIVGSSGTYTVSSADSTIITHKNVCSNYYVTFALKDTTNCQWSDYTTSNHTVYYSIRQAPCPFTSMDFFWNSYLRLRTNVVSPSTLVDKYTFTYSGYTLAVNTKGKEYKNPLNSTYAPSSGSNYRLIIHDTERTTQNDGWNYSASFTISDASGNFESRTLTIGPKKGSEIT